MTHPLWHLEHVYDGQRPSTHWWTDGYYYYNTVSQLSNQIFMIVDDTPTLSVNSTLKHYNGNMFNE